MYNHIPDNEPYLFDEKKHSYITAGQMKFYMNDQVQCEEVVMLTDDFKAYYAWFKMYNLISDYLKEDFTLADMIWNPKDQCIEFIFDKNGKIRKAITRAKLGQLVHDN